MTTEKVEIHLGQHVKDRITGYEGIVIGITHYLNGCRRCLVQGKVKDGTAVPEGFSFDEPDMVVIDDGLYQPAVKKEKPTHGPGRQETTKKQIAMRR